MKKLVVLSDTHANIGAIYSIYDIIKESDYVFHLGDHCYDMDGLAGELKDKLYRVRGNCDGGTENKELIVEIEGCKILVTHGDLYGVKSTLLRLSYRAKELGCNVCFYGHTHVAEVTEIDGVTLINPGSADRFATEKSFCYAVINGAVITAVINKNIG